VHVRAQVPTASAFMYTARDVRLMGHVQLRLHRDGVATGWQAATAAAASATAGAAESSRAAMMPGGDATGRSPGARQPSTSGVRPRARQRAPLSDLAPALSAPAVAQSASVRGAAVDGMDAGTLQLTRALHALQRSAAAVLADQLGPTGSRPPPEWGPLAGEAQSSLLRLPSSNHKALQSCSVLEHAVLAW